MEKIGAIVLGIHITMIIFGGLVTIFTKNIIRALTGLILTLFGVAGLYFLMAAPFIGIMQILIYVGAISILIFFAIAFTKASSQGDEAKPRKKSQYFLICTLPFILVSVLGYFLLNELRSSQTPKVSSIQDLGTFFLGPYMLPFELISVVLLVAMAGAVVLGFEKKISREE